MPWEERFQITDYSISREHCNREMIKRVIKRTDLAQILSYQEAYAPVVGTSSNSNFTAVSQILSGLCECE